MLGHGINLLTREDGRFYRGLPRIITCCDPFKYLSGSALPI